MSYAGLSTPNVQCLTEMGSSSVTDSLAKLEICWPPANSGSRLHVRIYSEDGLGSGEVEGLAAIVAVTSVDTSAL